MRVTDFLLMAGGALFVLFIRVLRETSDEHFEQGYRDGRPLDQQPTQTVGT